MLALRLSALALVLLLSQLLVLPAAAAGEDPDLSAFRDRHGAGWSLQADPATGRARRLQGGAVRWLEPTEALHDDAQRVDAELAVRAGDFLRENADLLDVVPEDLRLGASGVVRAGHLHVLHHDVAPGGVPVLGARVTLVVSHGSLVGVHLVGTAPVRERAAPSLTARDALRIALKAAGLERSDLRVRREPELAYRPEAAGHRLVWRAVLIERASPRRRVALVDATTGDVVAMTDETVEACDPVPGAGAQRRILGGVKPERTDDPERVELLRTASVEGVPSGPDGYFTPPAGPHAATLAGPVASVSCVACTNPTAPTAAPGPGGDADFGTGGADGEGNGSSTPADRTCFAHVESARRMAARWLDLPWLDQSLPVSTNLLSSCNAYWDGSGINFFRSSATCANTGEVRDVILHEWGHGLDDNDGLAASALSVDAATGEAVGDIAAMLRSRDACIGESFFVDPARWPSEQCSGVRDLDEKAPGHRRGEPSTLGTDNVAAECRASGFYRGPLGREGHCEGEILGQAFWHLAQDLLTGVSYADGTPLPDGALPEEQAWQLLERLYFTSRPLVASYAPSAFQSIGMSAYDALLLADDEGDGIANGTPHAAAIHEAFAHHGIAESATAPPDTAACATAVDPVVTASSVLDPDSGHQALRVEWTDTGAAGYRVLRADDEDDAYLTIHAQAGAGSFDDRAVLPDRTYLYRVVAEQADGCLSPGAVPTAAQPGASLVVAAVDVDDSVGGDGDGLLEPGERAELTVSVRNEGSGDATNLSVTLASDEPAVVVTSPGPIAFGDVPAGSTIVGPSPFVVDTLAGAPRFALLRVTGEADEACLLGTWRLELGVSDLDLVRADSIDQGADGLWEPGESVDLVPWLANAGLVDAVDVDGTLSFRGAPIPGVTIVRDTGRWDPLVPSRGAAVAVNEPVFQLVADAGVGPRTPVPLQLDTRIAGVPHETFDIDLTVGGLAPGALEWAEDVESPELGRLLAWDSPLVVPLTDDDGDGAITDCDGPDVIVHAFNLFDLERKTHLAAVSGEDGAFLWVVTEGPCGELRRSSWNLPAAGDIDGDGWNEVVTLGPDGTVCAFESDGTPAWTSTVPAYIGFLPDRYPSSRLEVWDLDGDGMAEVVAGPNVYAGVDGTLLWSREVENTGQVVVADLDLDGRQEILVEGRNVSHVFRADGSDHPVSFPDIGRSLAVANLDADRHPEVVTLDWAVLRAFNHDGTIHFETEITDLIGHVPPLICAADFDGDGLGEIAVTGTTTYNVIDDDGSFLWTVPHDDDSAQMASCAVFDFDGDGPAEVVFQDGATLMILDGRTGERLWETAIDGPTLEEVPAIVDLDGDGAAEIVLANVEPANGQGSISVWGSPLWPPARGVWNQVNYSATHVDDVGGIVANPAPSWLVSNTFRSQASECACVPDLPAMDVRVPDCQQTLACVTLPPPVDLELAEVWWDFGDGSEAVPGSSACHEYAAPGAYLVRVTAVGSDPRSATCPLSDAALVRLGAELAVDFQAEPGCAGAPSCFTAVPFGGVEPFTFEWDFGDGSPREVGETTCHAFAAGTHEVTVFVQDANLCIAEASQLVEVVDVSALPEVSPRGAAEPLLVARVGAADLRVTWERVGLEVGVYRGLLDELRSSGYTHGASAACRLTSGEATLPLPAGNAYYLAVASACAPERVEGSYGRSSLGDERPSAAALGRPVCP